jgi:predicted dehydrogenase
MNRRDFLQHTSVYTLAGMALPLPQLRLDEPVHIGIIGTGGRGTDLLRRLLTVEGAKVVALCDNYEPHLKKAAATLDEPVQQFSDYEEMLRKVEMHAVIIASPLYLHYEMCVAAIEAGCDVFCEKTMTYSVDEAIKLAKLVEERGTVFQVGLQRHASAIYRQALAMVQSGLIGQITAIKCQWHRNNDWRRPVPVPKDHPDWQRLEHHLNWRMYKKYSRGQMTELGSHQLDVANWVTGKMPSRVMGSAGQDYWRDGREIFDNVFLIYEYDLTNEAGEPYVARMTYSSIQNNAFEGASELIMGTKGSLYLTEGKGYFYQEQGVDKPLWGKKGDSDKDAEVVTSGQTLKLSNDPWGRGEAMELMSYGNSSRDQLVDFLDKVQKRDPQTICDVRTGMEDAITTLTGHRAMREKQSLELPTV